MNGLKEKTMLVLQQNYLDVCRAVEQAAGGGGGDPGARVDGHCQRQL